MEETGSGSAQLPDLIDLMKLVVKNLGQISRAIEGLAEQLDVDAVPNINDRLYGRRDRVEQAAANEPAASAGRALSSIANEPWGPEALSLAKREGIVIELKGKVLFANSFLMYAARLCRRKAFLSRCLLGGPTFIVEIEKEMKVALIMHFIFSTLKRNNHRVDRREMHIEGLTLMVNEILNRLVWLLLGHAYELGLIAKRDSYAISREANRSLHNLLYPMLSHNMSTENIRFSLYEGWRNIIATSAEDLNVEDKPFAKILPLFMYAVHYDHGLVSALEQCCRGRDAEPPTSSG